MRSLRAFSAGGIDGVANDADTGVVERRQMWRLGIAAPLGFGQVALHPIPRVILCVVQKQFRVPYHVLGVVSAKTYAANANNVAILVSFAFPAGYVVREVFQLRP